MEERISKLEKGIIFVVSGPSGAGKTTVCNKVVDKDTTLAHSISTTTRSPREGEVPGEDYKFVDTQEFRQKIRKSKFAEWAKVLDNYYGTEYKLLDKNVKKGKDIILSIDVQGAASIKKYYPDSVLIFLLPPSMKELINRLKKRGTNSELQIQKRLKLAQEEIEELDKYDYVVVNQKVKKAVSDIGSIINAERLAVNRYEPDKIIKRLKKG